MSLTPIALEIDQGDNETLLATVKVDGDEVDLTGTTLNFAMRTSAAVAPLITKTSFGSGGGILLRDQVTSKGQAEIAISPTDTSSLDPKYTGRTLRWELEGIDNTGRTTTLAKGTIVINRDLVT